MDLLSGYGSGSDSDDDNNSSVEAKETIVEVKVLQEPAISVKRKAKSSLLPSAAELFESVGSSSFLDVKPPEVIDIKPMKKQSSTPASDATSENNVHKKSKSASSSSHGRIMLPPQLTHGANKSTEDVSRWSTTSSLQPQEKKKKESFSAKEKRKRQQGKVSREGSFVEEEKRLLREAGN